MDATLVRVADLRLGSIVAKDILANTQYPIVYKNTKITREHLPVFQAFQIPRIPVITESIVETKENTGTEQVLETVEEKIVVENITPFVSQYNKSIEEFKVEFSKWQAGSKIDIARVRTIILPLIDYVLNNRSLIFSLNELSNSKNYIYHHSVAISLISAVVAQKMSFSKGDVIQMASAAALADCGMAKVNKKILKKAGALTEYELKEIQEHPFYSSQMVRDISILKSDMKIAIYQHHERLDGSGYPMGEKGNAIAVYSHIIAVADVFHAMTCERVYRAKESSFKVLEMIRESEFGKFNIEVVHALFNCVADLSLGTQVELSNFAMGTIVFINKDAATRPVVKIIDTAEIIDLSKNRKLYIERLVTK
ncbi:HD-GYP domain-containing protein [Viridibacillus sp. YIM B01967]|uniref:HD-GYP domain-containing protein n=1 Tax=Viridibacillus soli TaxID=2798301 RepID=A0ABS1HCY9_9BACL|nr:HD-GYP domain-containing protein [Viridibacillus soli]MBK3496833.1 HD-GYP domain-containing protein [Viridibacillus soli]